MNAEQFTPNVLRVVLIKNEVFRAPAAATAIRIMAGRAWLSANGKDAIGMSGEVYAVSHDTVISAIGKVPLILEVFTTASQPQDVKRATLVPLGAR